MDTFYLNGYDYIELNKPLKQLHLVGTGGEANISIEEGEVLVDEKTKLRKRHKLRDGYVGIVQGS